MTNEKPSTDNWKDFSGDYLKADMIEQWPAIFIPTDVETSYDEDGKAQLVYTGEWEGKKKKYQPNKTNIDILKQMNVTSPKSLIGCKIYFKQCLNFNPALKKKVPGLEIEKIDVI